MLQFNQINVNPKNRKTGDCSTRALVSCLNISYEDALKEQCKMSIKYCYGITDRETIEKIIKQYGYEKVKQPKKENGKMYKVCELDQIIPLETRLNGVIVNVKRHYVVVRGEYYIDTWNSGDKAVRGYYVKTK